MIESWRQTLEADNGFKLDDLGDAFLHVIGDLVCGSFNYKQLVPVGSAILCNNRTIALLSVHLSPRGLLGSGVVQMELFSARRP